MPLGSQRTERRKEKKLLKPDCRDPPCDYSGVEVAAGWDGFVVQDVAQNHGTKEPRHGVHNKVYERHTEDIPHTRDHRE